MLPLGGLPFAGEGKEEVVLEVEEEEKDRKWNRRRSQRELG